MTLKEVRRCLYKDKNNKLWDKLFCLFRVYTIKGEVNTRSYNWNNKHYETHRINARYNPYNPLTYLIGFIMISTHCVVNLLCNLVIAILATLNGTIEEIYTHFKYYFIWHETVFKVDVTEVKQDEE